jgi:mannose-6-phosphate isomerase
VTRDEFERRTRDGTVAGCFHVHHVARGDAMFLPSGRVHALGAGNVVFEIQQNSDTTYRVFDWNRVGLDGRPRELHLESSFSAIDFFDCEPELVTSRPEQTSPGVATRALVRDPLFDIDHVRIAAGGVSEGRWPGGLAVVGVVGGTLVLDPDTRPVRIDAGGFVLLPAAIPETKFRAEGPAEFLRVTPGE